ncbi:Putative UDP-glucose/GDP-mannose dehydrogenase [Magnetospira sp. QH-2]|nr:Putative UDP-glucose/GDP-mannose dehydrogenase [Magnetospira sp. QH-2]
MAAIMASKGHRVIGVDYNETFVADLKAGRAPVEEPDLQDLIHQAQGNLDATTRYDDAIARSTATFIIVPTPSVENGEFTNDYVIQTLEAIGQALRNKTEDHLVVVTSTVMPGSSSQTLIPVLEQASGRRIGEGLGYCYSPEFIALGSVVHDLLNPDFILMGESDPAAGDWLESIYKSVCDNDPPIARMALVNAELTKISVNAYVTMKISFANMLADVCDRLPGANVDEVTAGLGLDRRIGRHYLKGAMAFGGPCFPRDNRAFGVVADRIGARADLPRSSDLLNQYQSQRMNDIVGRLAPSGCTVAVLGLSYKPHTYVIEESASLRLIEDLHGNGHKVMAHDPMALDNAREALGDQAEYTADIADALAEASVVILATPWPQYRDIDPSLLAGKKVIDCWRMLDDSEYAGHCELHHLGAGILA